MRFLGLSLTVENLDRSSMTEGYPDDHDDEGCQSKRPRVFDEEFARAEVDEIRELLRRALGRASVTSDEDATMARHAAQYDRLVALSKREAMEISETMLAFVLRSGNGHRSARCSQVEVSSDLAASRNFLPTTEADDTLGASSVSSLYGELRCRLCGDFLCQPTTLGCGHSYCISCLERSNLEDQSCLYPGCTAKLARTDLRANLTLCRLLEKWFPQESERVECARHGRQKMERGKYAEAVSHFTKGLRIDGNNIRLLSQRSLALLRLHRCQESLHDAERCVQLEPLLPEAYHRRGMCYFAAKNLEKAALDFLHCARLQRAAQQETVDLMASVLQDFIHSVLPREGVVGTLTRLQILMGSTPTNHECPPSSVAKHSLDVPLSPDKPRADDLSCSLCYRLFHQPMTTPCGHMFCQSCLYRSMDIHVHCPLCRFSLTSILERQGKETTTVVDYLLRTYLPGEHEKRQRVHAQELGLTLEGLQEPQVCIPVFVCTLAVPDMPCPLHIYEPRYRLMMRRCLESGLRRFGMCMPCASSAEFGYADVGTLLEITSISYARDGRMLIECVGRRRFKVLERNVVDGYNSATVEWISDDPIDPSKQDDIQELHDATYQMARKFFGLSLFENVRARFGELPACPEQLEQSESGPAWVWYCVSLIPQTSQSRLDALTSTSLENRLQSLKTWFEANDSPFALLAVISYFQLTYFSP